MLYYYVNLAVSFRASSFISGQNINVMSTFSYLALSMPYTRFSVHICVPWLHVKKHTKKGFLSVVVGTYNVRGKPSRKIAANNEPLGVALRNQYALRRYRHQSSVVSRPATTHVVAFRFVPLRSLAIDRNQVSAAAIFHKRLRCGRKCCLLALETACSRTSLFLSSSAVEISSAGLWRKCSVLWQ